MKKSKRKIWGIASAVSGIVLMILGLYGGEFRDVFEKATRICLECIGIG